VARVIGPVAGAAVDHIEPRLVGREGEAVGLQEVVRDPPNRTVGRIDAVDMRAVELARGLDAFVIGVDAVGGIGEPDRAVRADHHVVGTVESQAFVAIGDHGDGAVVLRSGDPAPAVLAGHQPALPVDRVAVGIAGRAAEDGDLAALLVEAQHPVVGNVAPDQRPVRREIGGPLGPPASVVEALEARGEADLPAEALVQDFVGDRTHAAALAQRRLLIHERPLVAGGADPLGVFRREAERRPGLIMKLALIAGVVLGLLTAGAASAQSEPIRQTKAPFRDAFRQLEGEAWPTPTDYRNASGAPGHRYWQQKVDYRIAARLDEAGKTVTGRGTVTYRNNSPDRLPYLWLLLDQNVFRRDSIAERTAGAGGDEIGLSSLRRIQRYKDWNGGFRLGPVRDSAGRELRTTEVDTLMRVDLPAGWPPAPPSASPWSGPTRSSRRG
jgi:hypothetical protein